MPSAQSRGVRSAGPLFAPSPAANLRPGLAVVEAAVDGFVFAAVFACGCVFVCERPCIEAESARVCARVCALEVLVFAVIVRAREPVHVRVYASVFVSVCATVFVALVSVCVQKLALQQNSRTLCLCRSLCLCLSLLSR